MRRILDRSAIVAAVLLALGLVLFEDCTSGDGREAAVPLLSALETFHARHGYYPDALRTLVRDGLIPGIPSAPWSPGVSRDGFYYQVNRDMDFYYVFYFESDLRSGLGLSKCFT